MDVVTIATYARPEEAHLARLRLCRDDIPAFVVDDSVAQMNWIVAIMVGGVRLQVAEDDIEEARAILQDEPVVADGPNSLTMCPACGSNDADVYIKASIRVGVIAPSCAPLLLHPLASLEVPQL